MAYLTKAQARTAFRRDHRTLYLAEAEVRKSASTAPGTQFDVFLSHASEDAEVIAGVKVLLEGEGLDVYVDWIADPQADRQRVTARTADMLRNRMNHCRFLLYASSVASPSSKWMPWELGYFDGLRSGRVGILPLVDAPGSLFAGQEYLGLYPEFELIDFTLHGRRLGRRTAPGQGELLKTLAAS